VLVQSAEMRRKKKWQQWQGGKVARLRGSAEVRECDSEEMRKRSGIRASGVGKVLQAVHDFLFFAMQQIFILLGFYFGGT
jgi:hypothetical protein